MKVITEEKIIKLIDRVRNVLPDESWWIEEIISESLQEIDTLTVSNKSAFERFIEYGGDNEELPLERLRFFCSLAMNGQDWLDSEKFFNDINKSYL